ncbi:MAG: hypothetical protein ACLTSZ_04820 [Lachnospiraceae bacterium]
MEDTAVPYMPEHSIRKEKYEIQRVLGSGSFGVTYLALDLVLEHLVAIKEYAPVGTCRRQMDGSLCPAEGYEAEFAEDGGSGRKQHGFTGCLICLVSAVCLTFLRRTGQPIWWKSICLAERCELT